MTESSRDPRRHVFAPVERAPEENASLDRAFLFRLLEDAPNAAAGYGRGCGIEEHGVGIEAIAVARRSVDAPAIAEDGRQARDEDVPVVAGAILEAVELNFGNWIARVDGIEDEPYLGSVSARNHGSRRRLARTPYRQATTTAVQGHSFSES